MSRKKHHPRQLTVYLTDELSYAIDNWVLSFGLESRATALVAMAMAGNAAVPMETAVFELVAQGVKETRKNEFAALAEFYAQRSNMYRSGQ